jgi:hypothetical protein
MVYNAATGSLIKKGVNWFKGGPVDISLIIMSVITALLVLAMLFFPEKTFSFLGLDRRAFSRGYLWVTLALCITLLLIGLFALAQ